LESAIRDLEPSGILARHPLHRLAPSLRHCDRPIELVSSTTRQAIHHLDRLVQCRATAGISPDSWNTVESARCLLDYMKLATQLVRHGNLDLVDPTSAPSKQFAAAIAKIRDSEQALEMARQATTAWRQKLSASDVQTALEQARSWQGRFLAWMSPGWWRLRRVLRRSYDFKSHAVRPSWVQVLAALEREHTAAAAVDQATRAVQTDFHLEGTHDVFHQHVAALRALLTSAPEWLRRIHAGLLKSPQADSIVERTLAAEEPLGGLSEGLGKILIDFDGLSFESLRSELEAVNHSARRAPQLLGLLGELEQLPESVAAAVRRSDWTLPELEAAVARSTWDKLLLEDRRLAQFEEQDRGRWAIRLETAYDRWLAANAVEIFNSVRKRFLDHVRTSGLAALQLSPAEREFKRRYSLGRRALEHEFGKSMRFRAIRELVDGDTALVIQDLKPVWLMSPLSVSDTLPLTTDLFDVVIFDEASQVPLEESVPTLFRGKQVIIVGDEMQLPPTDFFTARQSRDEGEVVVEEEGQSINYDLDSESLLNHAARNLPSTMLGWHYRSRSESLISYSNWAFYDARLLTVPEHRLPVTTRSADPFTAGEPRAADIDLLLSRPLSFHLLKDGIYDQRRNSKEADYIADLVADLLKRGAGLSIGVIAFSEAQQSEIEASLNRLAQDDDEFRALYESELEREVDGQFVGLLVKNLENIQGDERDVIILSICYGPGPIGKMIMNFGPINKNGGEKRLNVAFSRAKQYMAVVSSIQHAAITNDYNDGANCLKTYLRYSEAMSRGDVESGRRVLAGISRWHNSDSVASSQDEDQVCRQLAADLREQGYVVEARVGQSHFRIDLAVRRADDAEYRLGILVDTVAQYECSDALERDMMRPRLLKIFGWPIAKVLAKDWYADRQRELSRILAILHGNAPKEDSATDPSDDVPDEDQPGKTASEDTAEATPDDSLADSNSSADENGEVINQALPSVDQDRRYFEYRDDKSNKFWEIRLIDQEHTVRFGRIGTAGQSQTKAFPDLIAARRDADKLIGEKIRKGYKELPSEN
jgi:predicted DNA-binding WGR domain protein